LELAEKASAQQPDNTVLRDNIVLCNEKLGDAWHDLRNNDRALSYFEKCLRLTLVQREEDPESSEVWNSLSFCYERLGNHWLQTRDPGQALEMYVKMRESSEQAIERDSKNRLLQEGLAFAYGKIGKAWAAQGRQEESAAARREAARIRRELGVR